MKALSSTLYSFCLFRVLFGQKDHFILYLCIKTSELFHNFLIKSWGSEAFGEVRRVIGSKKSILNGLNAGSNIQAILGETSASYVTWSRTSSVKTLPRDHINAREHVSFWHAFSMVHLINYDSYQFELIKCALLYNIRAGYGADIANKSLLSINRSSLWHRWTCCTVYEAVCLRFILNVFHWTIHCWYVSRCQRATLAYVSARKNVFTYNTIKSAQVCDHMYCTCICFHWVVRNQKCGCSRELHLYKRTKRFILSLELLLSTKKNFSLCSWLPLWFEICLDCSNQTLTVPQRNVRWKSNSSCTM